MFRSALHRSPACHAWTRCSLAPGTIREAVPQRSQERLPRCRGDCGSRAAANHALRSDQDAGADGPAGSASRALASRQPADGGDQSNPRVPPGARHHRATRCGAVAHGVARHPELKYGRVVAKNSQSIAELVQDWRRLDERIAAVSAEIEALAEQDEACQRVMTVPGVGPIISSAVVAAIGNGAGFTQG